MLPAQQQPVNIPPGQLDHIRHAASPRLGRSAAPPRLGRSATPPRLGRVGGSDAVLGLCRHADPQPSLQ